MTETRHPRAKSLLAQAFSIASGTALGQVALIVVTPLLTRIYSTVSFGAFGLFTSFVAVASVFVTLRLDMAIPSAATDADASRLLRITLAIVGPASLLCAPFVLVLDFGGAVHSVMGHIALIGLAAIATAAAAWFSALRYWHVRRMNFGGIGRAVAAQGASRAVSPLLLALMWPFWFGLALGDTIGRVFGIYTLGREAVAAMRAEAASALERSTVMQFLKGFRRYPMLLMPSSVLDAISSNLPIPIIAKLFGFSAAGEYALVLRVAAAPAALLGISIGDVFHARLAEALRSAPHEARGQLTHAAVRLALLGGAIYVPAALLAPLLFGFVFGEQWTRAGMVFAIMTPYLLMGLIVSPLSRALLATNRMELKLIVDILFMTVPATCLFLTFQHGFMFALTVFSCANALIYACYAFLIWRAVAAPRKNTE